MPLTRSAVFAMSLYLYWYGFSRWLRKLETGFHEGDTLPSLESYRLEY